jgi:hypothetical protein
MIQQATSPVKDDPPRLVLILDQPDLGHLGVFLGFEGPAPLPRLCTGDGDVILVPLGRVSFPAQLAQYDDRRIRRWALMVLAVLDHLRECRPGDADILGYLLTARAMLRRLGVPVEDGDESLLVRVLRVRDRIEVAPGVMNLAVVWDGAADGHGGEYLNLGLRDERATYPLREASSVRGRAPGGHTGQEAHAGRQKEADHG